MFYIYGVNVFGLLFAVSMVCHALYVLEHLQGRVRVLTRWSDLTLAQWFYFIGAITMPLWIVLMVLTVQPK